VDPGTDDPAEFPRDDGVRGNGHPDLDHDRVRAAGEAVR
jgi:hypothetical protein